MRSDAIPDDECPTLDDTAYIPSPQDEAWWIEQTRAAGPVKLLSHRHISPALAVALTETERPQGEEYRYAIRSYRGGSPVAVQGFDSLGDAETMFWHLTTPLSLSGSWVLPGEAELSDDATGGLEGGAQW